MSSVDPPTSANSTVTCLRSPPPRGVTSARNGLILGVSVRNSPHASQNRADARLSVPQRPQGLSRRSPQASQKQRPSGLIGLQRRHEITTSASCYCFRDACERKLVSNIFACAMKLSKQKIEKS